MEQAGRALSPALLVLTIPIGFLLTTKKFFQKTSLAALLHHPSTTCLCLISSCRQVS